MKAIVIKRKLSDSEIFEIQRLIDGEDKYDLFVCIDSIPEFSKYNPKFFELDSDIKRKINYDILNKILAFGDKKFKDKSVSEWLTFDNAGIWYYHKFRIYFFIRNLFYEINEIKNLSDNYKKVIYYTSSIFLKNYNAIPKNVLLVNGNLNNRKKINYTSVINYLIFAIIRFLIGIFKTIKNRKYLIVDRSERQTMINFSTLKEEKDNYYLSYLLEKIDNEFLIISEVEIPKFDNPHSFKLNKEYFFNPKKKRKRIFGEYILIKALFSLRLQKQKKHLSLQLLKTYKIIENNNLTPIEKLIVMYLKSIHKTSVYFLFKHLAYQQYFNRSNSKSITSVDENSPSVKSIFDAAKSCNIKTIGIQHGNIHDLNPAYLYTKTNKIKNIIPDYTLVWSDYWKNFLIKKGNYPLASIITVGQIRTDIIPHLKNIDKNIISDKFDNNKKLVIFASQPQRDPIMRRQAVVDVFNSVKDNPDIILIIKLHPAEKNDFNYYKSIAKKVKCENYEIILDFDLYLLLSICDILITCFSTVGTETIYFYKPLIILDHLKQDIQNFYKEGVAFQATNSKELKKYINDILNNKIKINNESYQDFINKYAYKIDGNVSKRCIDFIKNL